MSALAVSGLTRRFGAFVALDRIGFALEAGERVALIGPNGAGKSTCFALLGGQDRGGSGQVSLHGRAIERLPPERRQRLGLGRTFQIARVFASLSVAEGVEAALLLASGQGFALVGRGRHRPAALALLDRVGLAAAAERPAATLPYGDVKRLELALALAGRPRLLLLDEPTAGMAAAERAALMALVARLAVEDGLTLLFTEHDMDVVFAHAARILVLHQGQLIAAGPPERIRADPRVQEVYLGVEP